MNRYILFAGATYYANGGAQDLVGFYTTSEDAKTALDGLDPERSPGSGWQWAHLYDVHQHTISHAWESNVGWGDKHDWQPEDNNILDIINDRWQFDHYTD